MLVFTYGTLRRGQRNHQFMRGMQFEGEDSLNGSLTHRWGIPFLNLTDTPPKVAGEVFAITPDRLTTLDWLEGTNQGLYERKQVTLDSGRIAWVYVEGPYARGDKHA